MCVCVAGRLACGVASSNNNFYAEEKNARWIPGNSKSVRSSPGSVRVQRFRLQKRLETLSCVFGSMKPALACHRQIAIIQVCVLFSPRTFASIYGREYGRSTERSIIYSFFFFRVQRMINKQTNKQRLKKNWIITLNAIFNSYYSTTRVCGLFVVTSHSLQSTASTTTATTTTTSARSQ